ncbi:MAG: hypothetical protein RL134_1824 [Actinomycetota bacterium]
MVLRIDDADAARYRREYVDDIFRTLAEMGMTWTIGPLNADDFETHWSQRSKTEHYRIQLVRALSAGLPTYACDCSRTVQQGPAIHGCAGGCRDRGLALLGGTTALRVSVDPGTTVPVGGELIALDAEMGDFIVWRRDDLPAYQLVSVVEDRDLEITHIVRGRDLIASSAAQMYLARWLGADNVIEATYVHHELVTDPSGAKLSKTTQRRVAQQEAAP